MTKGCCFIGLFTFQSWYLDFKIELIYSLHNCKNLIIFVIQYFQHNHFQPYHNENISGPYSFMVMTKGQINPHAAVG